MDFIDIFEVSSSPDDILTLDAHAHGGLQTLCVCVHVLDSAKLQSLAIMHITKGTLGFNVT